MDTNVMNQICRVCGEPAAGFHFGAFTCEGCKSFFGRTYNNLNSISECKNNGECVINKKNRTSCKACRLRKCLVVGMSKSGSRYGRRSNWFKIHCLLQEQGGGGGGGGTGSSTPSPLTQKWMGGGGSGGMGGGSITPGDEDNNNVKKEPPLWRLPIPGMPLFGFPPPLPPFFLPRGLSLPPPPPPEPTPPPPPWQQQPSPVPPHSSSSVSPPLCFQAINAANINTNTTTTTTSSSSSPLDLLRSLGPVQDSPMDLRLRRGVGDMTMRTSSSSSQGGGSDRSSPGRDDIRGVGEDDMACGGSSDMSLRADHLSASDHASVQQQCERKVPLDLTCVKT